MKVINTKTVEVVVLEPIVLYQLENQDCLFRDDPSRGLYWFKPHDLLSFHNPRFFEMEWLHQKTIHIVDYDVAAKSPKHGMDHRTALKVLRGRDLRAPTCLEVFQFAVHCQKTDLGVTICKKYGKRLMCATAIHPEFPDYYYFGLGDGKGSFWKMPYRETEDGHLEFWGDRGEGVAAPPVFPYNFPLLLGVREEQKRGKQL